MPLINAVNAASRDIIDRDEEAVRAVPLMNAVGVEAASRNTRQS